MKLDNNTPIFAISVVSKLTDTPVRMLREYEKQGLIHPRKVNGRRMFTNNEIGFIKDIRYYLAEKGMTIRGLREFYLRAACWEIKRCHLKACPAYRNFTHQCWEVIGHHQRCDRSICPSCPVFIVKVAPRKKTEKSFSPLAYPGKTSQ